MELAQFGCEGYALARHLDGLLACEAYFAIPEAPMAFADSLPQPVFCLRAAMRYDAEASIPSEAVAA